MSLIASVIYIIIVVIIIAYKNDDLLMSPVIGNGVIIISPDQFERPPRWYYRLQECRTCELAVVTYDLTSITYSMKSLQPVRNC
jgi:hypothetical protein